VTKERWLLKEAVVVGNNVHQIYCREELYSHSWSGSGRRVVAALEPKELANPLRFRFLLYHSQYPIMLGGGNYMLDHPK
jgi:hypothetical protein